MRAIPGFTRYKINKGGTKVLDTRTGAFRKLSTTGGRVRVSLFRDAGGRCFCQVSRLVALTYIPNPHNKPEVNHLDCNPLNNRSSNLAWATKLENEQWKSKLGRRPKGINHPLTKLDPHKVEDIKRLRVEKSYTYRELADKFNVGTSQISRILKNKSWQ